jgi:hypothetical protein
MPSGIENVSMLSQRKQRECCCLVGTVAAEVQGFLEGLTWESRIMPYEIPKRQKIRQARRQLGGDIANR